MTRRRVAKDVVLVCAYAEGASGPGWANAPVWLVLRTGDGALRVECLQPDEQSDDVRALYGVCAAAHGALTKAVARDLKLRMA